MARLTDDQLRNLSGGDPGDGFDEVCAHFDSMPRRDWATVGNELRRILQVCGVDVEQDSFLDAAISAACCASAEAAFFAVASAIGGLSAASVEEAVDPWYGEGCGARSPLGPDGFLREAAEIEDCLDKKARGVAGD